MVHSLLQLLDRHPHNFFVLYAITIMARFIYHRILEKTIVFLKIRSYFQLYPSYFQLLCISIVCILHSILKKTIVFSKYRRFFKNTIVFSRIPWVDELGLNRKCSWHKYGWFEPSSGFTGRLERQGEGQTWCIRFLVVFTK